MVARRRFSNPLLRIRSFSSRRKLGRSDKAHEDGVDSVRKMSMDETATSAEDSRLNISGHKDIALFGAEEAPPAPGPNDAEARPKAPVAAESMPAFQHAAFYAPLRETRSQPNIPTYFHDVCACRCAECSLPAGYRKNEEYGLVFPPAQPPAPSNAARPADPALQARIEAVRIQQQLLGENHPDVIFALSSLAKLHQRRGDYREASSIMRESQMRSFLAKTVPPAPKWRQQERGRIPTEISFQNN